MQSSFRPASRRETFGRHSKGGRRDGGLKIDWTKPLPSAWPMCIDHTHHVPSSDARSVTESAPASQGGFCQPTPTAQQPSQSLTPQTDPPTHASASNFRHNYRAKTSAYSAQRNNSEIILKTVQSLFVVSKFTSRLSGKRLPRIHPTPAADCPGSLSRTGTSNPAARLGSCRSGGKWCIRVRIDRHLGRGLKSLRILRTADADKIDADHSLRPAVVFETAMKRRTAPEKSQTKREQSMQRFPQFLRIRKCQR
jgi:hypothetical protein